MIFIFNTFSNKKEKLISNYNNNINIYVCGITPYDLCHIGHGRILLIFDILIRYLKHLNYNVNYIRNITDIDNKIIKKSNLLNINFYKFTNSMIEKINLDIDFLKIIKPNHEPKVTNHINDIIETINILLLKKNAYIKNNDVLFNIKKYNKYGLLSNRKVNYFNDFVLWKSSNKKYKHSINEYNWISPWSIGRPGWHIECSTISNIYCKNIINIHGGGSDLIFPHHENELAQSCCAFKNFNIKIWMHIGQVNLLNKKMSKSTGNFIYLNSIYKYFDNETIRYYLSNKGYRKPLNFKFNEIIKIKKKVNNIYISLYNLNIYKKNTYFNKNDNLNFIKEFYEYMNDNLNIKKVYNLIDNINKEINKFINIKNNIAISLAKEMLYISNIIGLLNYKPIDFLKKKYKINVNIINKLIEKRNNARKERKWNISDNIRLNLYKNGIILIDTLDGTKWKFI